MRLAYITSSFPYGPGEAFLLPELNELMRQGHTPLIVPMWPRGEIVHTLAPELQAQVRPIGLVTPALLREAAAQAAKQPREALRALGLVLDPARARITAKNLLVYAKGLWLARQVRAWGIEHLFAHWAATTASMAMVASEVSGVPWSFTAHRWDIVENNLLARKLGHARLARFISESGLELLRDQRVEPDGTGARVLHLGVPLTETPVVATAPAGRPLIIVAANLIVPKGHAYLIEAIALLRDRGIDVEACFAGDGPTRPALEAQIAALGLGDRIRLLGMRPHAEIIGLYASGRVTAAVIPSLDSSCGEVEGIPAALMEAMSHRVPAISTLAGGTPELLRDGAGLLVPPRDAAALAEAIARVVQEPGLKETLSVAGRRRIEEQFAISEVVKELVRHLGAA